jgi:protocatechuate 3,4-dioxygenase beta subunit
VHNETLIILIILRFSTAVLLTGVPAAGADEPVIGGPCEGCEWVFVGMPETLTSEARIAPPDEPGEPLRIGGVVTDANGQPAAGVIVYAYHTDASGVYPKAATRHGRLRGWARTAENGRSLFDTIRPGAYPGRSIPQHVHMHVIEPGYATYWIDDIVFTDDPLLTGTRRRDMAHGRGGSGVAEPIRDEAGIWRVRRDIVLGLGVPGYRR